MSAMLFKLRLFPNLAATHDLMKGKTFAGRISLKVTCELTSDTHSVKPLDAAGVEASKSLAALDRSDISGPAAAKLSAYVEVSGNVSSIIQNTVEDEAPMASFGLRLLRR
jgi:hypothetical protein